MTAHRQRSYERDCTLSTAYPDCYKREAEAEAEVDAIAYPDAYKTMLEGKGGGEMKSMVEVRRTFGRSFKCFLRWAWT